MTALHGLGVLLRQQGDLDGSRAALERCLDYWTRIGNRAQVAAELSSLAAVHRARGDNDLARTMLADGIAAAREAGDRACLANGLSNLAMLDLDQRPEAAVALLHEALDLDRELGDPWGIACDHTNLAHAMYRAGGVADAYRHLSENAAAAVALGDIELTVAVLELFCMLLAESADSARTARPLGATRSMRAEAELPIADPDAVALQRAVDKVRLQTDADLWQRDLVLGAGYSVEDALAETLNAPVRLSGSTRVAGGSGIEERK